MMQPPTTGAELDPEECDVALVGGRVIDPESGLDRVCNVGIIGVRIAHVTDSAVTARKVIDVSGNVVAPGWIDLHSHAQSVAGGRLQARDGVTTALDLESGLSNVAEHYARAGREGRAINYGFSTSWQQARMIEVGNLGVGDLEDVLGHFGNPAWKQSARRDQVDAMIDRLELDLDAGAIGIGLMMGYAPRVDPSEYLRVSQLAAQTKTGTFTHARDLIEDVPDAVIDGAEEIVNAAQETGARAHYCHINSTSLWHIDRVHRLIERAQSPITTEAYPYGAGATAISADFLAPARLHEHRITPSSIVHTPTGERVADAKMLEELRATDPGAIAIVHFLDETDPTDRSVLERALTFPGAVVGSDAMPLGWAEAKNDPMAWPPPESLVVHPRGAGTFSRFFRRYVEELKTLSLVDAIGRCTIDPARVIEAYVPSMKKKGRIQVGCDADIVVFDPHRVRDRARYSAGTLASTGYAFVFVNGEVVVERDVLNLDALPGRPVRSARS